VRTLDWTDGQFTGLRCLHSGGAKDNHIEALAAHFGVP
jgi:hypothetical protein